MVETATKPWVDLDPETRRTLEAQYMAELESWSEIGLSDEAVGAYLQYRHERAGAAITTYEEGQIRKLLRAKSRPAARPDPVAAEEHVGRLEQFGAARLHMTNSQTYVAIMVLLTVAALLVFLGWLIWL